MARQMKRERANSKRANRPNPRQDRNFLRIVEADDTSVRSKKIDLLPRNISQERYLDLLEDETKDIVFAMGPAGTGKTYLPTLYAIRELQAGNIKKIIVTRPMVESSSESRLGALPGDITAKLAPWCIPVLDIFKEYFPVHQVTRMLENEQIELAPLNLMRGRTLKDAIMILDESQNATKDEMKMVLTRIGNGSRIFVTGDINQHDRRYSSNGLRDFAERLENHKSERIGIVRFSQRDIERHPVIEEILDLYGED